MTPLFHSLALGCCFLASITLASAQQAPAGDAKRGKYVSLLADCGACHTAPGGGEAFAGGYPMVTAFGTIYSSNITPSKNHGIGGYTFEQFDRALRKGIAADGTHLYPAMPYTSYVGMSSQDMADLYAFITQEVKPVDEPVSATALSFPFNMRFAVAGWNLLFRPDKPFQPDAAKDETWNRGAYLAEVLAHCSVCHSPRGFMFNELRREALSGGLLGSWFAPNITSDEVSGIGRWSVDDLQAYLKTGRTAHAQAAGGMAEAVTNSFQYMTDADLKALAIYIKSVPAIRSDNASKGRYAYGEASSPESSLRGLAGSSGDDDNLRGAHLFSGYCASCHQPNAAGVSDSYYPALFTNTTTGASRPENFISVILGGVNRKVGDKTHFMPGFGPRSYVQELMDQEVADVANYVFATYGNSAIHVTADDVKTIRQGGKPPPLAIVGKLAAPGLLGLGLLVALLLVVILHRRWRKSH